MPEELPWTERLLNWLRKWNAIMFASNIEEGKHDAALLALDTAATKEQAAYRGELYEAERNRYPEIAAKYAKAQEELPSEEDVGLNKMKAIADGIEKWMFDTYMKITPATPETALNKAMEILAADTGKEIAVELAGFSTEIASAGQFETATDWFKSFRKKTGYGGVMTMLMKSPIELGVIHPLAYQLHKQFRTTYIPSQTAIRLWVKELINEEQLRNAFAYEGYSESLTDALIGDAWRELRLGELAWALNDSSLDDVWLEKRLKYAMYAPEDRAQIAKMLKDKFLKPYRDRVATQARNLYKEGYRTYDQFTSIITQLDLPEKVRNLLASEAQYLYEYDRNATLISAWTTAYKNDIFNEDVLRGNLRTIIKAPERVEDQIRLANASRKPVAVAPPKKTVQGIKIMSKPSDAVIYLNNKNIGKYTPETLELDVGSYDVKIELQDYITWQTTVYVKASDFVELYAPLTLTEEAYLRLHPPVVEKPIIIKQGIKVSSKPSNANITLDGTPTKLLTPETIETTVGRHILRISAEGYTTAQFEGELVAGQFIEIYAVLTASTAP